jgi:hypothetical protein
MYEFHENESQFKMEYSARQRREFLRHA